MTCERCGIELHIGDFPFCPHGRGTNTVNGDEIPGGEWQENGFHTPQKFYSKKDRDRALAARGYEIRVRHVPIPGTDKSPYTSDWSKGSIDPQTLANAKALVERVGKSKGQDAPEPDVPVRWTIRELE